MYIIVYLILSWLVLWTFKSFWNYVFYFLVVTIGIIITSKIINTTITDMEMQQTLD